MGYIREYIESIAQLSFDDWQIISSYFKRREFNKGFKLVKLGETEKFLSFIENGIVRYYLPDEDKELTFGFNFEKEFTCAYDSFLTQVPAEYEMETLTKTVLWSISYSDLQKVYQETRIGNYWGRYAAEKLFLNKSRRELLLLKYNARERYLDLLTEKPNIVLRIPLKYVASYIGITPQALSRIRKEIC